VSGEAIQPRWSTLLSLPALSTLNWTGPLRQSAPRPDAAAPAAPAVTGLWPCVSRTGTGTRCGGRSAVRTTDTKSSVMASSAVHHTRLRTRPAMALTAQWAGRTKGEIWRESAGVGCTRHASSHRSAAS